MKKWLKGAIYLLGVFVFSWLAAGFAPEIGGLAWHLWNGSKAKIGSYVMPVPLLSWALYSDDHARIAVVTSPGEIRSSHFGSRDWAFMDFSTSLQPHSTEGDILRDASVMEQKAGLKIVALQKLSLAGQQTTCSRWNWTWNKTPEWAKATGLIEVECVPDVDKTGFRASFSGSPALLPRFFDMLRAVTKR
jgi:hypothetical protein